MRDPAENKDILPGISSPGDPADADRVINEINGHIKAARDRMRVLSLTRDAEDRGGDYSAFDCCWSRPRMWEQYGDLHRGTCLLFNRARLERLIREKWPDERTYLRNVEYTREGIAERPTRNLIDAGLFNDEQLAPAVAEYIDANHDAFFFLKSDDFATEYEYRVVLAAGDDKFADIDYGDSLVAVVLGERFPKWQRPAAIEACSKIEVKLGRMHWEHGRPHVLKVGP